MRSFAQIPKISAKRLAREFGGRMPHSTIAPKRRSARLSHLSPKWRKREAVIVRSEGREICNPVTAEGRKEYKSRIKAMLARQRGLCCDCLKPLSLATATFEHENGRTSGKRDDRIEIDGRPINGAAHGDCNRERGSRRTPIWHGE